MYSKSNREVYLCSEMVDAVYQADDRTTQRLAANLEEIAGRIATLCTETLIPLGAEVEVSCKGQKLQGVAVSAEWDDVLGWFIEIDLDADPKVGKQLFPKHLFRVPPARKLPKVA